MDTHSAVSGVREYGRLGQGVILVKRKLLKKQTQIQ